MIYCDTDSVIFIQASGEPWPIATGEKLGDIQSELKPSDFIVDFASGCPEKVIKVMILGQGETAVNVHIQRKFKRKSGAGGVVDLLTEPENKRYRLSFVKRRRMPDKSSVHLGYI